MHPQIVLESANARMAELHRTTDRQLDAAAHRTIGVSRISATIAGVGKAAQLRSLRASS